MSDSATPPVDSDIDTAEVDSTAVDNAVDATVNDTAAEATTDEPTMTGADDAADRDVDDDDDTKAADDDASDDDGDASDDDDDADGDDDEDEDGEETRPSGRSSKLAALDEEGDIAADYLEELLDIADLDGDIDTYSEGGRAHVSIVTDADILVGKDGEVLEALQDLCRLAVMTETGKRSRLMLDIAGHREKRRRELTDLASDAVEEAKASGESVRLTPMNPFERKIVHDVVAAAGLTSESDGEEPNRRVVVMPA